LYLDELRLEVFSGHEVGEFEVELDAGGLGGEEDGAARSAARNVVEVDAHLFAFFGAATHKHPNNQPNIRLVKEECGNFKAFTGVATGHKQKFRSI